jgi:hypothetical protein
MLEGPCFTKPLKRAPGGDYLAMSVVHERLYLRSLPGMNNTVRYIRVYSALCWMARTVQTYVKTNKLNRPDAAAMFEAGLWKIDALMMWISQRDNSRLPGYTKFGKAPTRNDVASITNRSTRLFNAANYGPSLVNGFGWLQLDNKLGILACSKAGRKLAEAFDLHLRSLRIPTTVAWLADPTTTVCNSHRFDALRRALTVRDTTETETKAFLASFIRAEHPDDEYFGGPARRSTLLLALRALSALNGTTKNAATADLEHIREAMLAGTTAADEQLDQGVEVARQEWHVMQLRALQRLALESLLVATEIYILDAARRGLSRSISAVSSALGNYAATDQTVKQRVGQLMRQGRPHGSLFKAGYLGGKQKLRYPQRMAELYQHQAKLLSKRVIGEDMRALVSASMDSLLFCAVETQLLAAPNKNADEALTWDSDRLALAQLAETTNRHQKSTTKEYAAQVIEEFVVVQHFQTAARRSAESKDGQQRFVFIETPSGLLRTETSSKIVSGYTGALEGLYHALLLLESGALVTRIQGATWRNSVFQLTASGRKLLRELNSEVRRS